MPPTNPRKRPAPGSPIIPAPAMPQSFTAPTQASNAEFLRWSQGPENAGFSDPSAYNLNTYGANAAPYDQSLPAASTQLARRPVNRQLIPTGQRPYDNTADPWGQFGDDSILDPQGDGAMEENDNIELLEEKAAVAKRDAQSKRKQIPPFVQKLSSFLDESKNTELIRWSDRGDSFVVLDEDEFAKTLIPELFKHNNYASFVRQLNMYGFHKRVGLSDNSMKASERKNKSPSEYYNPYFKRGHPNLLWLINKPKGGGKSNKKSRVKNEDGEGDSDDDGKDVEEVYGNNVQPSRALSTAPESGPLQRRDVTVLQTQLAEIQKQQSAITNAIQRLRKDHNQLYQQSMAFQTLHDRHENSINAILTFLATVYNRSLDGQGPQNIAEMFANGIPHNAQHQGSVVDIGDVTNQPQPNPGSPSPHHRRQQRLLMAPPSAGSGGRASTVSPSAASTPHPYTTQNNSQVEELFETSPPDTTHTQIKPDPSLGMMNLIHNANAATSSRSNNSNNMEFPALLSHYENANGNSPLTSEQRNTMLNLIANSSSTSGSNNALVTPSPPQPPSLAELGYTSQELEELMRLQAEQEARIDSVKNALTPLSPSGSIPGLNDSTGNYFPLASDGLSEGGNSNLDLDQYLDPGAFFNTSSPIQGGHEDYGYDSFGGGVGDTSMGDVGGSHFDLGMDGLGDEGVGGNGDFKGRIVEAGSSEAETPESNGGGGLNFEDGGSGIGGEGDIGGVGGMGLKSPSKRRKKN